MASLPLIIKERDVKYQYKRVAMFRRLLQGYPYTRKLIWKEARIDTLPLYRAWIWASLLGIDHDVQAAYAAIDKESWTSTDRRAWNEAAKAGWLGAGNSGKQEPRRSTRRSSSGQKTRRGRSVPMPVPVRSRCLALVGATPGTNRRLPACPCRGHLLTGAENFQGARSTTSGARPSSGSWEDRAGWGGRKLNQFQTSLACPYKKIS